MNGNKIIRQYDSLNTLDFYYGPEGITGFHIVSKNNDNSIILDQNYYYKKNLQGDIIGIIDSNGEEIVKYIYDAWGNQICKYLSNNGKYVAIEKDYNYNDISITNRFIAYKNPFRYRSYYYDFETGLYYLNSRYYDPEIGRFINADDISILSEGKEFINGLNLYSYCNNNPIMLSDHTGAAWWNWLISGLQIVVGVILVATGVGAGFGAMLIAGGAIGMITNIVDSSIGGGIGSILNGSGAISTGISLFSYGWVGAIFGTLMVGIGAATMVLGANEVAYGITKHNYLQEWTGMSDSVYSGLYLGLNIASSIGTITARLGMRSISSINYNKAQMHYKPYGKINTGKNIYYYNGKGNPYWAIHDFGKATQHWHTSLGRDGEHIYSFLKFIIKFIFRKW